MKGIKSEAMKLQAKNWKVYDPDKKECVYFNSNEDAVKFAKKVDAACVVRLFDTKYGEQWIGGNY